MNVLDYIEKTKNGNMQTSKACFEENLMDKDSFSCRESSLAGKAKKYVSKVKYVAETCLESFPDAEIFISNSRVKGEGVSYLQDKLSFSINDQEVMSLEFNPKTKERASFITIDLPKEDKTREVLNWKEAKEALKEYTFLDNDDLEVEEEEEEADPESDPENDPEVDPEKLPFEDELDEQPVEDFFPEDDSFEM